MNPTTTRFATLMGTASLLTLGTALNAQAQMTAQAAPEAVPEQVLVTGSLIHGTAAVGVPVTNLGTQDFTQTGAVTIGDLFRTVPQANVAPGPSATNSGGHQERETRVNIRGLDDRKSTRLNSSHPSISYAVFCLKKKKNETQAPRNRMLASHPRRRNVARPSVL